jgi:hypothetical protein
VIGLGCFTGTTGSCFKSQTGRRLMIYGRLDFGGPRIAGGDPALAKYGRRWINFGFGDSALAVNGSTERLVRMAEGVNEMMSKSGLWWLHPTTYSLPSMPRLFHYHQ